VCWPKIKKETDRGRVWSVANARHMKAQPYSTYLAPGSMSRKEKLVDIRRNG
jgi:hypothetical protein